ncbi:MAG: ABC transporter ATP-binding protein [Acidimicrobiia bacterium]|nr:ABC transporter ATP-binding protein [Acidimicrobiia bacterium]
MLDGIRVAYGDKVVLDGFHLQVEVGETVAVIGPSGSGKSTLLRAVAGLEPLAAGRILLDGRDLAGVAPHQRGVGLMFQDHVLFPHLNVADNVGYGLDRQGVPAEARAARIEEMLALVGLSGFGLRPIDRLSGGEAQRVALARALAPSPGLLMLDEPLGSLDRVLRDQLIDDLDELLHRMGQTSLHITHDQAEAFALADRVAVLDAGELVALGTPKELWRNPGSRFVAQFLGRPNIWTVEPVGEGRVHWVETGVMLESPGPTRGSVVVPVEAITVVQTNEAAGPDALWPLVGTVTGSRFHQGRYRHRVDVDVRREGSEPVSLVFVDEQARRVGDHLRLTVDLTQAIPLDE